MMKIENLTFQEAVAKLAEKCGVCLPEKEMSRAEKERLARLERLYKINDVTARYYQKVLFGNQCRQALSGVFAEKRLEPRDHREVYFGRGAGVVG